jgi:hypothetical protein
MSRDTNGINILNHPSVAREFLDSRDSKDSVCCNPYKTAIKLALLCAPGRDSVWFGAVSCVERGGLVCALGQAFSGGVGHFVARNEANEKALNLDDSLLFFG